MPKMYRKISTIAFSGVLAAGGFASAAQAACSDNTPGTGDTVTCDASAPNPDTVGVHSFINPPSLLPSGITVNVTDGAQVAGIFIGADGTVHVAEGATVFSNGNRAINAQSGTITIDGTVQSAVAGVVIGTPGGAPSAPGSEIVLSQTGAIETNNGSSVIFLGPDGTITLDGAVVNNGDAASNGSAVVLFGNGGTINQSATGTVTATGNRSSGLVAVGDEVTIAAAGRVTTGGDTLSAAVSLINDPGLAPAGGGAPMLTATIASGAALTTAGTVSPGVALQFHDDTRDAVGAVSMGGTIATTGNQSDGIFVLYDGVQGSSTIGVTGSIATSGEESHGIRVRYEPANLALAAAGGVSLAAIDPAEADNQIAISGQIDVTGVDSSGVWADLVDGTSVSVDVREGASISATGDEGYGVYFRADSGVADAIVTVAEGAEVFAENDHAIGEGVAPGTSGIVNTTVVLRGRVARPSVDDTVIALDDGDDSVVLFPTYDITGVIDLGDGFDTFILDGEAGTTGTLSLLTSNDARVVDGVEEVHKRGAGTWLVTGGDLPDAAALPPGFLDEGTLIVDSSLRGLNLVAATGTRLGGSGGLGDVTLNGTATLAPGSSIGTLTVGDLTLSAGSTFEVEVDANGMTDRVIALGTVTLNGATLRVLDLAGSVNQGANGFSSIIIDNDGTDAVSGTFGTIIDDLAFLTPSVNYDAGTGNDVELVLEVISTPTPNPGLFCTAAVTVNQCASASGLDGLDQTAGTDSAAVYNELLFSTDAEAQAIFDATSGEIYAAQQFAVAHVSDLFTQKVQRRGALLQQDASGMAGWASVMAEDARHDGDGNAARLKSKTWGFAGGLDLLRAGDRESGMTAGFAVGYLMSDADVDARLSSSDVDSVMIGLYAALHRGPLDASLAVSYGWHDIDTRRGIVFDTVDRTATSSLDAKTYGVSAAVKYAIPMRGVTIAPLVTLDVHHVDVDSAAETGAQALSLVLDSAGFTSARGGIGAELGFGDADAAVRGSVRATYEHELGDRRPDQFAMQAGSAFDYEVFGPWQKKSGFAVGAGLDARLSERVSLTASYDGSFNGDLYRHRGAVTLNVGF